MLDPLISTDRSRPGPEASQHRQLFSAKAPTPRHPVPRFLVLEGVPGNRGQPKASRFHSLDPQSTDSDSLCAFHPQRQRVQWECRFPLKSTKTFWLPRNMFYVPLSVLKGIDFTTERIFPHFFQAKEQMEETQLLLRLRSSILWVSGLRQTAGGEDHLWHNYNTLPAAKLQRSLRRKKKKRTLAARCFFWGGGWRLWGVFWRITGILNIFRFPLIGGLDWRFGGSVAKGGVRGFQHSLLG